jgi:hypothetical protein
VVNGIEQGAVDAEGKQVVVRRYRPELFCSFYRQLSRFESFFIERYRPYSRRVLRALRLNVYDLVLQVDVFKSQG